MAISSWVILSGAPSHRHPGSCSISSILCLGIALPPLYGPTPLKCFRCLPHHCPNGLGLVLLCVGYSLCATRCS